MKLIESNKFYEKEIVKKGSDVLIKNLDILVL